MYRYQFHLQVKMAHWRDFQSLVGNLNAAMQDMGLVPYQLWEAKSGRLNQALMVADYESLAAFEREHDAMHADPTCMSLWREITGHTDGTAWTDLWWRPKAG